MNPETLINDLIKENADYTIRDYLDMMAELRMIEATNPFDKIIELLKDAA